jgi:glutamine synthetase
MSLATLKDRGVQYLFLHYVNAHGASLGKILPLGSSQADTDLTAYFAGTPEDGLGQQPNEEEVSVSPNLADARVLPWDPSIAWIPCSLSRYGKPHPQCGRSLLEARLADFSAAHRLAIRMGLEIEFYVLKDIDGTITPVSVHEGGIPAYSQWGTFALSGYWAELHAWATQCGIGVQTITHEGGRSQIEFSLKCCEPLRAVDDFFLFKFLAKRLAADMGYVACFMPKPLRSDLASGLHLNLSFHDDTSESLDHLYPALAGLVSQLPAITAVACPTINSYRRLWATEPSTTWISNLVSVGVNDRTKLVRIVPRDGRAELRLSDPTTNLYILTSLVLAAVQSGISAHLRDPGGQSQAPFAGVAGPLPRTLAEALDSLEASAFTTEVLGEGLKAAFLRVKREEWNAYVNDVPDWELQRYLYA